MPGSSVRDRLSAAAFSLFDERGFEGTTVADIAERAGVGRATVFRRFQSKEDLIFPDHGSLLRAVENRLHTTSADATNVAVFEALNLVLRHYMAEGDLARARYRLTRSVPTLTEREATTVRMYQRLFFKFFRKCLAGQVDCDLRAELAAAGVVTAHNHVLRRWLREQTADPEIELRAALSRALPGVGSTGSDPDSSVIVLNTKHPIDDVVRAVTKALGLEHAETMSIPPSKPRKKIHS